MPFLAKCYNGHKLQLDSELDGETVECPICEDDFIATSEYEELGKVIERAVPYNTRGYIHMGTGLVIGSLFTYLITVISNNSTHLFWQITIVFSITIGFLYIVRGIFELFRNEDPFWRANHFFFAIFYIVWKKIKFFRK